MDEGFLLKSALMCSIIGMIALYFISGKIDAEETAINRITSGQSDGDVLVSGRVGKIVEKEGFMVMEIEKKESIPVFVFRDDYPVHVSEGQSVEIRGEVQEYEGKKEIVAYEIRIV